MATEVGFRLYGGYVIPLGALLSSVQQEWLSKPCDAVEGFLQGLLYEHRHVTLCILQDREAHLSKGKSVTEKSPVFIGSYVCDHEATEFCAVTGEVYRTFDKFCYNTVDSLLEEMETDKPHIQKAIYDVFPDVDLSKYKYSVVAHHWFTR